MLPCIQLSLHLGTKAPSLSDRHQRQRWFCPRNGAASDLGRARGAAI